MSQQETSEHHANERPTTRTSRRGLFRDVRDGLIERQRPTFRRRHAAEVSRTDLVDVGVGEAVDSHRTTATHRGGLLRQRLAGIDEEEVETFDAELSTCGLTQPGDIGGVLDEGGEFV